ncbi:MAG: hypothetical protein ACRECC_04655 [Pseudolabrys sp.]|jgi:hypothetical protein
MRRTMIAAAASAAMLAVLPVGALSQQSAPKAPEPPKAAETPKTSATPKTYIPGLEQFMGVILTEHAKLWYAGSARNWELAEYQLGEIKEVMSDVQDLVPTFKNLPLADMLDAVITGQIADLEKAIDAKDPKKFADGYGKLTDACNACHQATGNGFVVIKRPGPGAFPNQDFSPRKQ